jgi:glyoxylase-like metal-dependent hydrolase (beta-lactamase superfamily II)
MRIDNLTYNSKTYSSNAYLLRGDYNALDDVNTLIDTGRDEVFFENLRKINTGLGKKPISQLIITHGHYDHTGLLAKIKAQYGVRVYAFSDHIPGVDKLLSDGEYLKVADDMATIIHSPGHSADSICIYCFNAKALFVGDTPVFNLSDTSHFEPAYVDALEKISRLDVNIIFPGHGKAIEYQCNNLIKEALKTAKNEQLASRVIREEKNSSYAANNLYKR